MTDEQFLFQVASDIVDASEELGGNDALIRIEVDGWPDDGESQDLIDQIESIVHCRLWGKILTEKGLCNEP